MNPHDAASSSHGDATLEELQALLQTEAPAERRELERTWHLTRYAQAADVAPEEVTQAREAFRVALRASASKPRVVDRNPVRRPLAMRWPSVVITAIAVGCAALAWFLFTPVTVQAPAETTHTITLADGSSVLLNSGSTLQYYRAPWRATRAVTLDGEAYFTVTKAARPFVVQTFNAEVQVLGTAFNVRAWPEDETPATTVLLRTGRVQLTARNAQRGSVTLAPGQASHLVGMASAPTNPERFDDAVGLLWLTGGFAFIDRPLSALFTELERKYGIDIEVSSSIAKTDTLTWVQPRLGSAEDALVDICALSGCRFERKQGGFIITSPEELPER